MLNWLKTIDMIIIDDIRKGFGRVEVLKGISLEVREHAVTSIVGPSGAGKTTLLQIMGTLERPDGGRVLYDGTDVMTLGDRKLSAFRNANIGFVFQSHQLLPEFTLQENVAMPGLIGGRGRKASMERARELLEQLGLGDRLTHKPSELSGGEAQRGAVARALLNSPRVVLADEPSGSLDSRNRSELHRLFFRLCEDMGVTFVIVTHDESLARDSHEVVRMAEYMVDEYERLTAGVPVKYEVTLKMLETMA